MGPTSYIRLMASYNQWMNDKIYEAAARLSDEELAADKGAFFGSILGTLSHLLVVDLIWLARFATHPANYPALQPLRDLSDPTDLHFADIRSLVERRKQLDETIAEWVLSVTASDLQHILHYTNGKGIGANKNFFFLIMHFFNHQTHHRGQVTTLLSQHGIDVGVTDLNAMIPNEKG